VVTDAVLGRPCTRTPSPPGSCRGDR
jgi:hypothetical protein